MKVMGIILSLITPGFLVCGWMLHRRHGRVALPARANRLNYSPRRRTRVKPPKRVLRVLCFNRLNDRASALRLRREETRQQPWEGRN
jgi:hypothetical protein